VTERREHDTDTQTERVSGQPVDAKAELWHGRPNEGDSTRGTTAGESAEADEASDDPKRSE
jgi:hypothetical protein